MENRSGAFNRDLISASVLLLLAGWIWYHSGRFPDLQEGYPGPKLFPRIIALGLGGIGLVLALGQFGRKASKTELTPAKETASEKSPLRLGIGILCIAAFPLISPLIGFIPALLLTGALIGLTLQVVWWRSIITAAITVGLIYLIFSELLNVPL